MGADLEDFGLRLKLRGSLERRWPLRRPGEAAHGLLCANLGRGIPPLFETAGKRYHGIVAGLPEEVSEMLGRGVSLREQAEEATKAD